MTICNSKIHQSRNTLTATTKPVCVCVCLSLSLSLSLSLCLCVKELTLNHTLFDKHVVCIHIYTLMDMATSTLPLLAAFALSALVGSLFKSLHGGTLILAPVGPAVPTH